MPIYEYECTKCGRIEEAFQKFSDKPLTKCRHCSGQLHKLISQSTFHLKGNGWYVTDYANKSNYANKSENTMTESKKSKTTSSTDSATATPDKKTSKKSTE